MSIEPPKKPVSWEQNPEIIDVNKRIAQLKRFTSRGFYGNENWRDKEASIKDLESTEKQMATVVKKAKEQHEKELRDYNELFKIYEEAVEKEAKELELRQKRINHPILGLNLDERS